MQPADLPHFTVAALHSDSCEGRFDPSPWVGEGWITGLYLAGGRFLWGRFRDIDLPARTCLFCPDSTAELSVLRSGESYPFMDGYWGERAELVLSENRHWQRALFEPADMVRYPAAGGGWMATRLSPEAPSGGQVVPGGWDHEHCDICQQKIGHAGEPEGFFSPPDSWVCAECYPRFVAPRSLAFVCEGEPPASADGPSRSS
jgi:hypothetical protein